MSAVIEKYYHDANLKDTLLKQKLQKFGRNPDIASEFEYWIQNKTYTETDPIEIEGYTAEALSELSEYLRGEGSFLVLIELRENPEKALKRIAGGFKWK